jgi:adenylate cyclase
MLAEVCMKLGLREQCTSAAKRSMVRLEAALARQHENAALLAWGAATVALLDDNAQASAWANRAVALSPNDYLVRLLAACAYACTGNPDAALECLEFNYSHFPRQRRFLLVGLVHDAQMDPIRDRAEFRALVKRLEVEVGL